MTETLRVHRIALVVLSLLYLPFYVGTFVVTAAVNLGGGGVQMDGILLVSSVTAGVGATTALVATAVTRGFRWPRVSVAWVAWLAVATGTPVGALALWDAAPLLLWSPPLLVGVAGAITWRALND